jgi:hypothetical protein
MVEASELAGRLTCSSAAAEEALGSWYDERRFDDEDSLRLCANDRGFAGPGTPEPGEASRSRNESRECPLLVGVSST